MASYFTLKEKEEIIQKLRTLYSQHDSQLQKVNALGDNDSIVIHDDEGNEKRVKLATLVDAMPEIISKTKVSYTVSTNVDEATVTLTEVLDDSDSDTDDETQISGIGSATIEILPGTKININIDANDYLEYDKDVVVTCDANVYITLVKERVLKFFVYNADDNALDGVSITIKPSYATTSTTSTTSIDDEEVSGVCYFHTTNEEDINYVVTMDGYKPATGTLTLGETHSLTEVKITLEANDITVRQFPTLNGMTFPSVGGIINIKVTSNGTADTATVSLSNDDSDNSDDSDDDVSWAEAVWDTVDVEEGKKGGLVRIVAARNYTGEERSCVVNLSFIAADSQSLTLTQDA